MYFYDDVPSLLEIVLKNVMSVHLLIDESKYNSLFTISCIKLDDLDRDYTIFKVNKVIEFFKQRHTYTGDLTKINSIIFQYKKGEDVLDALKEYLYEYIYTAFKQLLDKEDIYLRDIIDYYNMTPIYTESFYGIQKVNKKYK